MADEADDFGNAHEATGDPVVPTAPKPAEKVVEKVVETPEKVEVTDSLGGDNPDGDDETPEEKLEREAAESKAEREKRIRIPKARFDEAMEKSRKREEALTARLIELEKKTTQTATQVDVGKAQTAIDELQDKYEDLILDGKRDEAKAVRKRVEAMRDQLIEYKTSAKSDAARQGAIEELKFDTALARVEATFEELNPGSDKFDEDKTDEVAVLLEAFIARGFTRHAALDKAVKYVMGPPKEAKGEAETAEALREARAAAARVKAAAANGKQPASMSGVGEDSSKKGKGTETSGVDIMRMKQADFAKLDEDTLSKLRGDEL